MLGSIGAAVNLDINADVEIQPDLALEAGTEVQPTQLPHPSLIVNVPSGYPEDFETFGRLRQTQLMLRIFSVLM